MCYRSAVLGPVVVWRAPVILPTDIEVWEALPWPHGDFIPALWRWRATVFDITNISPTVTVWWLKELVTCAIKIPAKAWVTRGRVCGGHGQFCRRLPLHLQRCDVEGKPGPARNERHLRLQIDSWTDAGQPLGSIFVGSVSGNLLHLIFSCDQGSFFWNMSDGWLKILYSSQSTMTVAPFASLLGSILGQPVGIDRWSGLSELADHQDHGVWRKYKLQANIRFFLHISVRGKWFWIDETGTRCIDFGRNVAYVEATAAAVKTLNMDSAHTSVKDSVEQEP